jgi:glutathione peroxidase-family protein
MSSNHKYSIWIVFNSLVLFPMISESFGLERSAKYWAFTKHLIGSIADVINSFGSIWTDNEAQCTQRQTI